MIQTTFPCHNHICILHLILYMDSIQNKLYSRCQLAIQIIQKCKSKSACRTYTSCILVIFTNHFGSNLCIVFHACIQNRKDIGGNSFLRSIDIGSSLRTAERIGHITGNPEITLGKKFLLV